MPFSYTGAEYAITDVLGTPSAHGGRAIEMSTVKVSFGRGLALWYTVSIQMPSRAVSGLPRGILEALAVDSGTYYEVIPE